jgi:hypothetical protein
VLQQLQAMVGAGQRLSEGQHSRALSEVLRDAYVAVTRQRVLCAG